MNCQICGREIATSQAYNPKPTAMYFQCNKSAEASRHDVEMDYLIRIARDLSLIKQHLGLEPRIEKG